MGEYDEQPIEYRRSGSRNSRHRHSFWKDGREYVWNEKIGDYVYWIKKKGRRSVPLLLHGENAKNDKTQNRSEWRREIESFRRDDFERLANHDVSEWKFNAENGDPTPLEWVASFVKPIPKPPKREPHDAPRVASQSDFIENLELAKRDALGAEEARIDSERTRQYAENLNDLILTQRRLEQIKNLLDGRTIVCDAMTDSFEKQRYSLQMIEPLLNEEDALSARKKLIETEIAEEKARRDRKTGTFKIIWENLFPDRGGREFFSKEYRVAVSAMFEKLGVENIADDVFEFYNALGRAFNLKQRSIQPPRIVFKKLKPDVYGQQYGGVLALNATLLNDLSFLREAIIHEFGHWFESYLIDRGRGRRNAKWLMKEQQSGWIKKKAQDNPKKHEYYVPNDVQPTLCPNEYSQRIYRFPLRTELVPEGMRFFLADPELFARRYPKHFELLIENFRELENE